MYMSSVSTLSKREKKAAALGEVEIGFFKNAYVVTNWTIFEILLNY